MTPRGRRKTSERRELAAAAEADDAKDVLGGSRAEAPELCRRLQRFRATRWPGVLVLLAAAAAIAACGQKGPLVLPDGARPGPGQDATPAPSASGAGDEAAGNAPDSDDEQEAGADGG